MRFWSTLLHVETDAGRVWVKENAPSQAFEAGLVAGRRAASSRACAPRWSPSTPTRGWLATADLGLPLWHDETPPPPDDWVAVVAGYSAAQHVLADHADAVLAAGVPLFPEAPDDVVALGDRPARRPPGPPGGRPAAPDRRGGGRSSTTGSTGSATRRAVLAASGLPSTLQHNDLHLANAFRRPDGGMTYIDLGDSVWAHPLTTMRIPLWIMRHRFALAEDDPDLRRARDAGLEPWTDRWDRADLAALLPAADRLSCLHRAESWARLQRDVPLRVVDDDVRAVGGRVGRRRRRPRPVRLGRRPLNPSVAAEGRR